MGSKWLPLVGSVWRLVTSVIRIKRRALFGFGVALVVQFGGGGGGVSGPGLDAGEFGVALQGLGDRRRPERNRFKNRVWSSHFSVFECKLKVELRTFAESRNRRKGPEDTEQVRLIVSLRK